MARIHQILSHPGVQELVLVPPINHYRTKFNKCPQNSLRKVGRKYHHLRGTRVSSDYLSKRLKFIGIGIAFMMFKADASAGHLCH